jgi:hypothetical protein
LPDDLGFAAAGWPFKQKRLLEFRGQEDDLDHYRVDKVAGLGQFASEVGNRIKHRLLLAFPWDCCRLLLTQRAKIEERSYQILASMCPEAQHSALQRELIADFANYLLNMPFTSLLPAAIRGLIQDRQQCCDDLEPRAPVHQRLLNSGDIIE